MTVETKRVSGRRTVHYESMDELLADAERLAAGEVRTLGNWSLGQILKHQAVTMDCSIDGFPFLMPAPMRFIMRLAMKKRFLTRPLPPGFQIPQKGAVFIPGQIEAADSCIEMRRAIDRLKTESKRSLHPALGRLTQDEWTQLHLRHAELHMSFVVSAAD